MTAINEHVIKRVRIAADGRNSEFLSSEGNRGTFNLFNDPQLFKTLQEAGVDLSVMPVDNTGNALFGVLNTIAFPLVFFGGIFLINRSRTQAKEVGAPQYPESTKAPNRAGASGIHTGKTAHGKLLMKNKTLQ